MISKYIDQLRQAATTSVDWSEVMAVKRSLDMEARTSAQRAALADLSHATQENIHRAVVAVEREFASPFTYDANGWPTPNPSYSQSKRRK